MFGDPILRHILTPNNPAVKLLSTASDTTDLTTYTFSAMDIGGFGDSHPFGSDQANTTTSALLSSPGRAAIACIVHGEDAATTFGVSSVTIGGVAGTEAVDRGGGTSAINTAIYIWTGESLRGIANTDVVVVWNEAVTSCAVGIIEITNLTCYAALASGSAQGTGAVNAPIINLADSSRFSGGIAIFGSSCVTGGGTETPEFNLIAGTTQPLDAMNPTLLYHGNNAELDFAAAFSLVTGTFHDPISTVRLGASVSWSGTGAGDLVGIYLA